MSPRGVGACSRKEFSVDAPKHCLWSLEMEMMIAVGLS